LSENIDMIGSFAPSEIEAARELVPRTIELLKRERQMVGEVVPGRARREARYDARGTFRVVLASVLAPISGGSIVQAARLVSAIAPALEGRHFALPYGEGDLGPAVRDAEPIAELYAPGGDRVCPMRLIGAARRGGIDVLEARNSDFVVIIVDGRFVGHMPWRAVDRLTASGAANFLIPVLSFHHSGRGAVKVDLVQSEAGERQFFDRLQNAESLLMLNVSLAIRRALVAIADHRSELAKG